MLIYLALQVLCFIVQKVNSNILLQFVRFFQLSNVVQ